MIIGVTGSIGSGKSLCSSILADLLSVTVFDADTMAKKCMAKNGAAYETVIRTFGNGILGKDYEIDSHKLRDLMFENNSLIKQLNDIIHPIVNRECVWQIEEKRRNGDSLILDIPLLFEVGLEKTVDVSIVVAVSESVREERLRVRSGLSRTEIKKFLMWQLPQNEKIEKADFVICNDGTIDDFRREITSVANRIKMIKE